MKKALITGINGQDGSYLASHLLQQNYEVFGLIRNSNSDLSNLSYLKIANEVNLLNCNLLSKEDVDKIIQQVKPDEIYNLAAQSSVYKSYINPIETFEFNTLSVFNLIESVKKLNPNIRLYQASSSEMYGKVKRLPITENSLLHPVSPYAISKVAAHYTCVNYRESYNMYVACGILFNHETYLRSKSFFIKKVLRESLEISVGKRDVLYVGNIDIKRDFGYAPKYIEAMHLMLQARQPTDYLICSGESTSLRSIIYYVFDRLGINREKCVIDKKLYRPSDIEDIYGSKDKAEKHLNWNYKLNFHEVLNLLLEEEIINFKININ